jgi:PAS fold.
MFGYAPSELGPGVQAIWAIVHPDDLETVRMAADDCIAGRSSRLEVRARMRQKSGL